jgi:hypothetical protein
MRRFAVVVCLLSLAACNRKKADPEQGFHPDELGSAGALPPPPSVGPGALGGGGGSLPPASGEMPNDDVHAGIAATGGANPHAGGGDIAQMGAAMGCTPPDPSRAMDPKKFLKGTIHPADATKDKIPPNALIYISVKKADPKTGEAVEGMPIATDKETASSWPLTFELTEANLMCANGDFSGDIVVTARYAQGTDPLMKQDGDVMGHVRATIPADKLDIPLDTIWHKP